jgi:hypothetical protein
MRLAVIAWIVGATVVTALVVTRLIAFGPEQATPFDTFLLVLGGMVVILGAVLVWQVWAGRRRSSGL